MKSAENFKLFLFIGSMLVMFFVSVVMALFLFMGAEKIGETLLWTGVVLSMGFNVIVGLLGGSEYARSSHEE